MAIIYPNKYKNFGDYQNKNGYSDIDALILKNKKNTLDSIDKNANLAYSKTRGEYDDAARNAFIQKMKDQQNLSEQVKKNGYSGGLADSFRLEGDTTYQNNAQKINTEKANALGTLLSGTNDKRLAADSEYNSALATLRQQAASEYSAAKENENSRYQSDYWNQLSADKSDEEAAYNRKWSEALQKAQYKDYSGLNSLGVDTARFAADEEYQTRIQEAAAKAEYGDLSGLSALGIDTGYLISQRELEKQQAQQDIDSGNRAAAEAAYNQRYQLAIQSAASGDPSLLNALIKEQGGAGTAQYIPTTAAASQYASGNSDSSTDSTEMYASRTFAAPEAVAKAAGIPSDMYGDYVKQANKRGDRIANPQNNGKYSIPGMGYYANFSESEIESGIESGTLTLYYDKNNDVYLVVKA